MFPNYHLYLEAITDRNLFIAFLALVAAIGYLVLWSLNQYVPKRYAVKAWIVVWLYYSSLAGVVVLLGRGN
jgi:hypothetical protein